VGNDVFTRSGAFRYNTTNKPSCERTRADVHIAIEGNHITLDNTWAWHADHDDCEGLSDTSYSEHGLVVTGADVIALGLQVRPNEPDNEPDGGFWRIMAQRWRRIAPDCV